MPYEPSKDLARRLRSRITFRRPVSTPTGKGGFTKTWQEIDTVFAEVISQNGREAVIASTLQGVSSYRITIRFRTDLKASDQILYGTEALNITAPPADPDGKRIATVIFAETQTTP